MTTEDTLATTPADTATDCACGHPLSAHDAVATRYCKATVDHARVRGCICKVGLKNS